MHSKFITVWLGVTIMACGSLAAQGDARREIQLHFERAQAALKASQLAVAADEFSQILRLDPRSAAAHANLGMIAYRRANYGQAVQSFDAALKLNPSLWDAQAFLGLSHERLGHGPEARSCLEQSFPHIQNPGFRIEVGLDLIRIAQESNTPERAVEVLRDLQRSSPNDPEVLYASYRIYSDLAARALGTLALAAPESARLHQILAQAALSQDDVAGAIAEYRKVLQIDPHVPGVHYELGRSIIQASQDETARQEAQREFEAEIAANPRDASSEYELGQVYSLRSDLPAAAEHYLRALQFRPDFVEAHLALGKILSSTGHSGEAFEHFKEAARLDPNNEIAHYRLAQAYRKAGKIEDASREQTIFQKLRESRLPAHSVYGQAGKKPTDPDKSDPPGR